MKTLVHRPKYLKLVEEGLERSPIVSLLGPRQAAKTTLARQISAERKSHYFDLEDPESARRLEHPKTAIEPLEGLAWIFLLRRKIQGEDPEQSREVAIWMACRRPRARFEGQISI